MPNSYKVMIVDDEKNIRDVLVFTMKHNGYHPIVACDAEEAIKLFNMENPDIIILDINLPKLSGFDVCREIRKTSDVPIIFLTVKDDEIDKVLGLELGGDDYITKPFGTNELMARVRAILRREKFNRKVFGDEISSDLIKLNINGLSLNRNECSCSFNDKLIPLTKIEFEILWTVMKRPDMVFTRDMLIQTAYDSKVSLSPRTIDSHIKKIRDKFSTVEYNPIQTMHGFGYKMNIN